MNEDSESELLATVAFVELRKRQKHKKQEFGAIPGCFNGMPRGLMQILFCELETGDPLSFVNFSHLFQEQFCRLLELASPLISRENTNYRDSISPGERLMITSW